MNNSSGTLKIRPHEVSQEVLVSRVSRKSKVSILQSNENSRWLKQVPPEDFRMNTVSKVNPFKFIEEYNEDVRHRDHRKKLDKAYEKRHMYRSSLQTKKNYYLKQVNENAGPEWYQDLSFKQMELVSDLRKIIAADLERGIIDETQQFLKDLGIVPQVDGSAVRKAQIRSETNPIKFLFMIQDNVSQREQVEYLTNHKKNIENKLPQSRFSLNERLILSSIFFLHYPILADKLDKILPPPWEPPRVRWTNKKKKTIRKHSSPYLDPLPINDCCWYEERAMKTLEGKVRRKMAAQEARDRLKAMDAVSRSFAESRNVEKDDIRSELSDNWLKEEVSEEQLPLTAKRESEEPQKAPRLSTISAQLFGSLEQLNDIVGKEEAELIRSCFSDPNLLEGEYQDQNDNPSVKPANIAQTKKKSPEARVHPFDVITRRVMNVFMFKEPMKPIRVEDYTKPNFEPEGISSSQQISATIGSKLMQWKSLALQTDYEPDFGCIGDTAEQDVGLGRGESIASSMALEDDLTKPMVYQTNGFYDYMNSDEEPSENVQTLMYEIQEDMQLMKTMDGYITYADASKEESKLTLPSDHSYNSIESYLYDTDYKDNLFPAAKKKRLDRKEWKSAFFCELRKKAFTVECNEDKCGKIASHEDIPMDEFVFVKRVIAHLPENEQLKEAIKFLCDQGDPLAVLPEVHKVPVLVRWFEKRRHVKYPLTEADKDDLMDLSRKMWDSPYFQVTSVPLPSVDLPNRLTWKDASKVKKMAREANDKYQRLLRQQLVQNARNYFPTMFGEYFESPLNKSYRRTFFDYMPCKEGDALTIRPWRLEDGREGDQGDCGRGAECKRRANQKDVPNIKIQ